MLAKRILFRESVSDDERAVAGKTTSLTRGDTTDRNRVSYLAKRIAVKVKGPAHRIVLGQRGEVRRKEADAAGVSSEAVQDSISDGHAVVGRSTAAQLVENDQRARRRLCKARVRLDVRYELRSAKLTFCRILLQSSISTLNVEALAKMKSFAPMRE